MKKQVLLLAAIVVVGLTQVATATNDYPIVLVHGLTGWGRDELNGFKYWGGHYGNYQEQLKSKGFKVFTASVGPFSSNWDRACELYAQIKGGRVDYGANHSSIFGHARYGRSYPGFFPQWGTVVDGKLQKVHLIGHSMGGQTIRMLAQLLNGGTAGSDSEELVQTHPLFTGGKDWVHSVTTISTPNRGTTLGDYNNGTLDLRENVCAAIFGAAGIAGSSSTVFYDAKLDQWGIGARGKDETIDAYLDRVLSSKMFAPGFKDICAYPMTTWGAAHENEFVSTLPNVFYYSIVTVDTFDLLDHNFQKISFPRPSMASIVWATAIIEGSRFTVDTDHFPESWQPNDGLVNVPSQWNDGHGAIVDFDGKSTRGAWTRMPTLNGEDHGSVIGLRKNDDMIDMYTAHATLLKDLPAQETLGHRRLESTVTHPEAITSAIKAVETAAAQKQAKLDIEICKTATDTETKMICELYLKTKPTA